MKKTFIKGLGTVSLAATICLATFHLNSCGGSRAGSGGGGAVKDHYRIHVTDSVPAGTNLAIDCPKCSSASGKVVIGKIPFAIPANTDITVFIQRADSTRSGYGGRSK
jgi:hypothetical protein